MARASLVRRYGPGLEDRTRQLIEGAGFDYTIPVRVPRSLLALQLAELARLEGRHADIHRRLFTTYWSEGRDIGDPDVLVEIAAAAGLDRDKAREVLESDAYSDRVRQSTAAAQRLGVNGVPAWLLDGKLLIPGAQPHETFDAILQRQGYEAVTER